MYTGITDLGMHRVQIRTPWRMDRPMTNSRPRPAPISTIRGPSWKFEGWVECTGGRAQSVTRSRAGAEAFSLTQPDSSWTVHRATISPEHRCYCDSSPPQKTAGRRGVPTLWRLARMESVDRRALPRKNSSPFLRGQWSRQRYT